MGFYAPQNMLNVYIGDDGQIRRWIVVLEAQCRRRDNISIDAMTASAQHQPSSLGQSRWQYQPRKRAFVPGGHFVKSLNSTRLDGTGPDMAMVKEEEEEEEEEEACLCACEPPMMAKNYLATRLAPHRHHTY